MKFIIDKAEKGSILEMHSMYKKNLLDEQYSLKSELQNFITNECIQNGQIVKMSTTDPNYIYAVKKKATKESDTYYYFFIDKTVAKKVGTSEDAEFLTDTQWKCQ